MTKEIILPHIKHWDVILEHCDRVFPMVRYWRNFGWMCDGPFLGSRCNNFHMLSALWESCPGYYLSCSAKLMMAPQGAFKVSELRQKEQCVLIPVYKVRNSTCREVSKPVAEWLSQHAIFRAPECVCVLPQDPLFFRWWPILVYCHPPRLRAH
jgi:hypothetical protein